MRRHVITATALTLAAVGLVGVPGRAAAAGPASVAITGHGFGHGRGMGQWGSYGYAKAGSTAADILAHFYGGTTLSAVDQSRASSPISVRLDELDGASTVTAQGPGLTASWSGGSLSASPATVSRTGSGLTVNGQATAGDVTLQAGGPVQLGLPDGSTRSYNGAIVVRAASAQVIDVLALDQYVAGVVPAESPASWGVDGEAALQAQAVAARSYALAWVAAHGTAICDTTACQVYAGDQDVAGAPTNSSYTTYSDRAVSSTAGQVLLCQAAACGPAGSVVLAEFSSSTGGYSAGGAFPAVADTGDSVSANPNHTWSVTVPASTLQAAWPRIGNLQSVAVTARNGLGESGGRATQVQVAGDAGSVSVSGDAFAAALGLRSNWFSVSLQGRPSGGLDGYWVLTADGAVHPYGGAVDHGSTVGRHLSQPVVAMAPTADQGGYWEVAGDGGIFTFGDARFFGSTGALHLNRPVIGMAATPTGAGYWLFAADGGIFTFGDARFHGSTGAMHLNQPIVGMAPTPSGAGYWLVAADGGIFTFGDARYFGSTGAMHLNRPVVDMVPSADAGGYTLVAADGGVFTFGDARFVGSLPGEGISDKVSAVTPSADGGGYLVAGPAGHVHPFGDAPYFGDPATAGVSVPSSDIFGHRG